MNTQLVSSKRPLRLNSKLLLTMAVPIGFAAQASTDYGPAFYREAYPGHWYTSGYGKKFFVVHDIEGYYWSCISYFQRSTTRASVHYTINGKKDNSSDANPGEVTQMVRDAYYAWHAGCWNQHSMGTEHEGFASNPAWYTPELYQASADLTRSKADKYGFPKNRNYIVAHGEEVYTPSWPNWAAANLGINGYCQTHTDPGPYWDWSGYMNRINPPSGPPTINPPYGFDSNSQGWTAGNSMTAMAWTGDGWPGIIYNDQVGNDAFNYGPPMNFGGGGDPSLNVSVYPQSGNTANHDMQVFWKTAQDNTWSASKSSPIVTYSAQNNWITLNLDINANWPGWFGKTINQLRLDFDNNNSGTRWIVNHVITQTTPRFWFGGGTDGWGAANGLTATWWTDCCGWPGILVTDQVGNDAHITKGGLAYRGAQNDRVYVRLFPQGGSGVNHDIKLYWATQLENFYSEAKSTPLIYYSGKDTWVDIWFDVGANGYWHANGPITAMRLDFDANNQGVRWIVDQIQVVHNGSANFAPYNNASTVSISAPANVNAGATFSATVVMNNSGSTAWSSAAGHALGSQSPQDNTRWGMSRVGVAGTINPGANSTFTFNATAPSTLGAYAFDWKMVQDGVQWFGPIAQATVNVVSAGPAAPSGVSATAAAWDQVNVNWADNSGNETGFKVQRSTSSGGPFSNIATVAANATSYSNTGLSAGTTYYYRVLSFNSGGDSAPSNVASVATPNQPPSLGVVGNKTGTEGQPLTFTASSSNPNQLITTTTWATWEGNNHNDAEIVFRKPINSSTTSSFIDTTATNYALVSSSFPAGGGGARVLKASWSFKSGTANPWIRFTTAAAPSFPNPTISQDQILRFKIYSTKALKVGLGVRETGTSAAYGANGGTAGTIEWAAVTNVISGAPVPSKAVAANTWTTIDINVPFEAQAGFTGNGVIGSGKGVLEHLALRAEGGTGVYDVYVDDFAVVEPNTLTFSLDAGAPSGASIHPKTGVFTWTPAAGQSGTHNITVRVTDRLGLNDFETISVSIVSVGNHKPVLAAIGNKAVDEGSPLTFTANGTDQDAGQTLTYSLDSGNPAGSSINSSSGAFTWTPSEAQGPGTYPITVRVTDNGSPATNAFETITVTVNEVNAAPALTAIADQTVNEGGTVNASASATDADVPANSITYSLDAGAPVGMTINPSSGAISWTTTESHGPDSYPVTVRATDGGGMSDARTFNVTVNELNTAPALSVNTTITSVESITDFEAMAAGSYNGTVLFRQPSFSSTTSSFLDTAVTNSTSVTTSYPGGDTIQKVLHAAFSIKTGQVNPWVRLTTFNTALLPNPTVNFNQRVRFKIYTDKALGVALGLRETDTAAVIGQNGGTTGTMEWAGATATSGAPVPSRTVAAGAWTTLEFNLPSETITAFNGNSVLTSTTGKGVLEHLALTPAGGTGLYNVYIDNLEVVTVTTDLTVNTGQTVTFSSSATDADFPAQTLTYSLDTPPAGATINSATGAFSWTPGASQGPSTNVITVRVTDNGPGNLSDTENVTIVVNKVNTAPQLNGFPDQAAEINGGDQINITVGATDGDGDSLTFSLQGTPPTGAAIHPTTGVFTWTPPNTLSSNAITVRVTDNGVPSLYDQKDMIIIVTPTNTAPALSLSGARITEKVVNFESIANYASDVVMFRKPFNSSSTSAFIDTAVTNYTHVATSGVPAGNPNVGGKTLKAGWTFKSGTSNPWLRLTSFNPVNIPNVTIDLGARIKFDIHSDKAIKVGLGIRETGTSAAIGGNGGTTGAIEWIGATKSGTTPNPSRVVNANTWTTLEFNLPAEYCTNYISGNSVLATGKGVLEHLIIVPNAGTGAYVVYLDNFEVVSTPSLPSSISMNVNATLTYTAGATDPDPGSGLNFGLDADTPAGSTIGITSGAFSWTPAAAGSFNIVTYVNDNPTNGAPQKTASNTFAVTVTADSLAVQTGTFVAGGDTVNVTWDSVPGQTYLIQVKAGDSDWADHQTVTATGGVSAIQIANDGGDSHFRVIEVGGSNE